VEAYALVPSLVTHSNNPYSSIGNQRHPRARYYCKILLGIDFDRLDGYSTGNDYQYGAYRQSTFPSTTPVTIPALKWKGVDISHFDERQQFYQVRGMPPDNLMHILRNNGVNTVRFSVFVGEDTQFNTQRTLRLAKLADEHGLRSYVVLHFSDTWTNPGRQQKPAKWNMLSVDELAQQVYQYSKEVVTSLCDQGTPPSIIQVGNEITNGMLWAADSQPYAAGGRLSRSWEEGHPLPYDSQWFTFARLVKMAVRGIHEGTALSAAKTKVMLHIDRGEDVDQASWWFQRALEHNIEYDLIGLSFNPLWHEEAHLENLYKMAALAKTLPDKEVIIAETSFPYRPFLVNKQMYFKGQFPFTQEGQQKYLVQALNTLQHVPNVTGIFWWGTTFIHRSFHPDTDYFNARALFDSSGVALPALSTFLQA
jgi:arabinogalactan endo-1,4-beta-galactosidase